MRGARFVSRLPSILLVIWVLVAVPVLATEPESSFTINLSGEYRRGGLRWNIAGDLAGQNPNILSELTWSNLQIFQVEGEGELSMGGFTIRGAVGYGWVLVGDTRDSDYNLDDRAGEWSRSYSDASGGYLLDLRTALGYRWDFESAGITLLPVFGIAFYRQSMVMADGVQIIPATGSFPGLDSSYMANWLNLYFGADLAYRPAERVTVEAEISVHPSLYRASADWNLRTDLAHPVSFVHRAVGLGLGTNFSICMDLSRKVSLEGRIGVDYWFAGRGVDKTFFAAGGSTETRLNEVIWFSPRFGFTTVLRLWGTGSG